MSRLYTRCTLGTCFGLHVCIYTDCYKEVSLPLKVYVMYYAMKVSSETIATAKNELLTQRMAGTKMRCTFYKLDL